MTMQEDEVSDLKYITIRELENIINTKAEGYTFTDKSGVKELIDFVKSK